MAGNLPFLYFFYSAAHVLCLKIRREHRIYYYITWKQALVRRAEEAIVIVELRIVVLSALFGTGAFPVPVELVVPDPQQWKLPEARSRSQISDAMTLFHRRKAPLR
jgi:hypothetical protein